MVGRMSDKGEHELILRMIRELKETTGLILEKMEKNNMQTEKNRQAIWGNGEPGLKTDVRTIVKQKGELVDKFNKRCQYMTVSIVILAIFFFLHGVIPTSIIGMLIKPGV